MHQHHRYILLLELHRQILPNTVHRRLARSVRVASAGTVVCNTAYARGHDAYLWFCGEFEVGQEGGGEEQRNEGVDGEGRQHGLVVDVLEGVGVFWGHDAGDVEEDVDGFLGGEFAGEVVDGVFGCDL